jgi:hypothetical protein
VPLFQAQRVDLVLSGNSHNYERTFPLTEGVQVARGGITYVVSGGGGNGFNAFGAYTQPRTAFRESSYYEYTKITVAPTGLTVDAVRSDTNSIFDTTTIPNRAAPPPVVAPPVAPVLTPPITTTPGRIVEKTVKQAVKRSCIVPKVTGKKLKKARHVVVARGCRVKVRYLVSRKAAGRVIAQSRRAGKKLGFHAVVKLTVARNAPAKAKKS